MYTQVENKKKASLQLNSSSPRMTNSVSGIHKVGLSSRNKWSFTGSPTRKGSILAGHRGSKLSVLDDKSEVPKAVQVLDDDGNDVTPLPLNQEESGDKFKQGKFFCEEIFSSLRSERLKSTSTFNLPTASSFMDSSTPSSMRASMTKESEDSVLDVPMLPPAPYEVPRKRYNVEPQLTEEMLDEVVDILLHETDTISLLDIPNTSVSEDAEEAEAIEKANIQYAELCKNRLGNDKFVVRSTQTFNGALKNKQIQSDEIVTLDEGTMATVWDIYDSFCDKEDTTEDEAADFPESVVNTSNGQERKDEKSSSCSTVATGSTVSSLVEKESCRSTLSTEPNTQLIMSESFQYSLLVMERSIVTNLFQPKLAAYRKLPILEDPDSTVEPGAEEQSEECEESSSSPTLEPLWSFSCELTRGRNVTCMALNKENPDLLAVGYGDLNCLCQKPGLICCWSLKNPSWPERVIHCHSSVTSLEFSAENTGQLAVGMFDGTVSIYNVKNLNNSACIASTSDSSERHMHPVWHVRCIIEEMSLSREDSMEMIVSVSTDGRVTKWLLFSNAFQGIDLMKIRRTQNQKKTEQSVLPVMIPLLCIDFHPTDSSIYLVGTHEGKIHKCSISKSQDFLGTYKKHICPVNHLAWSPFSPDVFLSCSSDWSIQLWRQDLFTPVLSFTSNEVAVLTVRWSPWLSTVFAAIKAGQLEIWDLNSNILNPTIVHPAPPGVRFTSLQFTRGTDCLLVGDSDGQVTVYQIKNLSVGEGKQGNSLDSIVRSVVSGQLNSLKTEVCESVEESQH
ncbi:WD repeat-containing protein 78 [Notolabrus celidotus]|uniref:WD repeat-containing protein 78 n=1 Tax=Notolabrus celidotus TaxID=1203425 RepID=UPI00148F7015|nr:WD repeat-containing protein 78 [Notolabrus celidotus]